MSDTVRTFAEVRQYLENLEREKEQAKFAIESQTRLLNNVKSKLDTLKERSIKDTVIDIAMMRYPVKWTKKSLLKKKKHYEYIISKYENILDNINNEEYPFNSNV